MFNGNGKFVGAAAAMTLAVAPMAHAADTVNAVTTAPHHSQAQKIDPLVALQTEMESIIPESVKPKFYLPLSPESKKTIAFFYQGFKQKAGDRASLSALLEKSVVLLFARETNDRSIAEMTKAVEEMEKTGKDATPSRLVPISSPIFTLSVILPSSDNSPYSQAFATLQHEMEEKYAKGSALQKAIMSKDPESVRIAKKNLAASEQALKVSRERLATVQIELERTEQERRQSDQTRRTSDDTRRTITQARQTLEGR